jgi:hypothetical protein
MAVIGTALVAAGCGSGDDELSKSEFLAKGNAICKQGNKEINAAANKLFVKGQAPDKATFDKFANGTLIPSIQKQIDGISDLNPPSADEDQVNKIVDEAQAALDKVKKDPHATLNENSDPCKKANADAKAYGLKACAG